MNLTRPGLVLAFSLLACVSLAHAEPEAKKRAAAAFLPQILQEVEAKYTLAKTMQAEFSQVNEIASLKRKETSTGRIEVKRPDKLRWETLQPNPTQLISDGKHFWFYTPPYDPKDPTEHGQVIERKSSQIQSKVANALLSGSFSVARDMKIVAEGAFKFVLTPKPGSAGTVKRAWIEINPTERLIQKVTIEHRGGNRSEITLSKIELGVDMNDERFEFHAPANTDRIDP